MKKIFLFSLTVLTLFLVGCKKYTFNDEVKGEALSGFNLKAPSNNLFLQLNSAMPNSKVTIEWSNSKTGVSSTVNYTWVAIPKTQYPNFESPLVELPATTATSLVLTQKQLDDVLKSKGVADGGTVELVWTVFSNNGTNKVKADQDFSIKIKRFGDGVSSFLLLAPQNSETNFEISPSETKDSITFAWQHAKPGVAANPVSYRLVFVKEGQPVSTPLFSVKSAKNGVDSFFKISYKDISDSLSAKGLTDFSELAKLQWTVVATSGSFSMQSEYINKIYIVRLVRMYLVGSPSGWNINAPFEMVADKSPARLGKVFYTYITLKAGDEFKFVKTVGDWGSAYGQTGGSAGDFTTGYNQGGNFSVNSDGVYRLTVDAGAGKAYVQKKQVGLVGQFQSWTPANVVLGGLIARNKTLTLATIPANDEFKFHDGTEWENGAPNKSRWWGKGAAAGTLDVDGNGDNVKNTVGAGRVRAIWDATDPQQVKYELHSANEMRVVGNGINQTGVNDWDPPTSPQMTYQGNGVWKITLNLKANKEIKFLAGNAWGAFDYEDAGGGKIKYEGGDNFKTPATAGTYTITLDEYNGTITGL